MQAKATALSGTSRLVKTSHVHPRQQRKGANVVAKGQQKTDSMTGIVFKPFDEVCLRITLKMVHLIDLSRCFKTADTDKTIPLIHRNLFTAGPAPVEGHKPTW